VADPARPDLRILAAMHGKNIRIQPYGRTGNLMFQYMLGHILHREVPGSTFTGYRLPEWDLANADPVKSSGFSIQIRGHSIELERLIAFLNEVNFADVVLMSVSCRQHYYQAYLDDFRKIFPRASDEVSAGADKLLINVRLEDISKGMHPNYMPLPVSWYARIIDETGLDPIFLGQLDDGPYTRALRRRFPGAKFLNSVSARADFDFIRRAVNIVPCISTFSWLASWFAEDARAIFFPVAGIFNPRSRPDIDLLCLGDRRYQFYDTDLVRWHGTAEELKRLARNDDAFAAISHAEAGARFAVHLGPAGSAKGSHPV